MPKATLISIVALLLVASACTAAPEPTQIPTLAMLPSASPTASATATLPPPTSTPTETFTLTPSITNTPSRTPTETPAPPTGTAIRTSTFTPSPTATLDGTPAIMGDASVTYTSSTLVDLHSGPGFNFSPIQALSTGAPLFLMGRSWDSEWYQARMVSGQEGWVYWRYLLIWIDANQLPVTWEQPTEIPFARVDSFALGGHLMDFTQGSFNVAQRAGMSWVKVQHRYYVGQSGADVMGKIQAAHGAGFRVLLSVIGDKAQMDDLTSYAASYANFVAEAAALGADAIEIWNEPNIDREWPIDTIHGGNYTQLLAAAYTAIKGRAPNTIVISAGLAPTGFFGPEGCGVGGCNDDIFLKQMALAGAVNYLDCVGMHHNDGIISPLQVSGDPRGDYPTYYFQGLISRVPSEFNTRPLCFTELGYLSPEGYGSLPGSFAWAQNTTVANQAQWLGDAVRLARSTGRVEMLIVWNLDFTVYSASDPMAGYAILRPGGGCPACDSLAAAIQ